ncbi:MAG TPA: Ldh family oxidoreductase [Candidatus Limnocylindrales bacterium]|nr:Ldh family oxidoreductase [Candidatus Limnocylindrales bacterium]
MDPQHFPEGPLRGFAEGIVVGLGASEQTAQVVSASLIEADRRGVHTHGLVRLPSYCAEARAGRVVVDADPCVEREHGPTAMVDGRAAFGAITGTVSMDEAIARAETYGVGFVTARGCNHFGAAAFYSLRAVSHGMVGIVATSTPAVMAPWGGAEARLGNNPLSIAAPTPEGRDPFVLDLAQSAVSRGRIKLAELHDEPIPDTWALDAGGLPTTDPAAALAGALLPSGGYKGYGLALALEVLTGVLAGAELGPELINTSLTGSASSGSATRTGTVGSFYVAVDPERFVGREVFTERLARLVALIKATPPAVGFSEVLVPGELEERSARAASEAGIELDARTVALLEDLGASESVAFPSPADRA